VEDINAIHYEEPCPFDNFDATKAGRRRPHNPGGARRTGIPVMAFSMGDPPSGGGHCAAGPVLLRRPGALDPRRPMAEQAGLATTLHVSGGFGFVVFAALCLLTPRIALAGIQKGVETYGKWFDPPLRIIDGAITVPKGPGVGLADPKEIADGATRSGARLELVESTAAVLLATASAARAAGSLGPQSSNPVG